MKWGDTTITDWRNLWGKLGQENWGPGKTTYIVSASFCYGNGYIWQAILT
jgi:hypothetical protein